MTNEVLQYFFWILLLIGSFKTCDQVKEKIDKDSGIKLNGIEISRKVGGK